MKKETREYLAKMSVAGYKSPQIEALCFLIKKFPEKLEDLKNSECISFFGESLFAYEIEECLRIVGMNNYYIKKYNSSEVVFKILEVKPLPMVPLTAISVLESIGFQDEEIMLQHRFWYHDRIIAYQEIFGVAKKLTDL